jgi:outer membrane protein insertion porin family
MSRIFLVLLALTAATPVLAQDQPGRCLRPDSVVVRGNERVGRATIVAGSGIIAGDSLNFVAIQRALRDLYATGDFETVDVECGLPADGTGSAIVISVTERAILGQVSVLGPSAIPARNIEDRVTLLIGRPVDPSAIAVSMRRIDSLYKARGYYLARIRPETTSLGDRIGITFRVNEGRRLAVSGLRVLGTEQLLARDVVDAMETKPEGFFWFRRGEFDEDV